MSILEMVLEHLSIFPFFLLGTWVAVGIGVGGAVVGTAGSVISSRNENKAREAAAERQDQSIADLQRIREELSQQALSGDFLGRFGTDDIFGRRPQQVDLQESVRRAAISNLGLIPTNERLVDRVNQAQSAAAIERAAALDPNFQQNIASLSDSARSLLRGEIPEDVMAEIRRRRAEGAAAGGIGTPGAQTNATSRDLGLTSLGFQQQGASLFQVINQARQAIDPIERQVSMGELLLSPEQQINADIANRALRASHDPAAQQLFGINLQGGSQEAIARGQVSVPVDNSLGTGLSGFGGTLTGLVSSGAFGSGFGSNNNQQRTV